MDAANILGQAALDAHAIAAKTDMEADAIARHLRALSNVHIFNEVSPNVFKNNEASLLLQQESAKALVGLGAEEGRMSCYKQWEALSGKRSGQTGFNLAYQTDLSVYDYWKQVRPDWGQRAARAFSSNVGNLEQYLALYPWAKEPDGALVVDVGGGIGGATLPIIKRFTNLKLQVQDREENGLEFIKHLENDFPTVAASHRASFIEQDFFQPNKTPRADVYFMRHILHNWPDASAKALLGKLSAAMSPSSKLLLCEHVVYPAYRDVEGRGEMDEAVAPEPLLANWGDVYTSRMDVMMLAALGARERSRREVEALVGGVGLVVWRVWRNMGTEAIVECRLCE
ncbi:hypothetical protein CDD81_7297 [Ophiocordyceps australis]|uniref:O-methyltransferase C-terminal domain-containing protein n=1 Tax=Ophiocordyceps australis TaxID=1399860 RepID=A0A2C5Y0M3_9HYPO|nr:hypothetical protein CDD81_7297 [Ophiocordyceps australis]